MSFEREITAHYGQVRKRLLGPGHSGRLVSEQLPSPALKLPPKVDLGGALSGAQGVRCRRLTTTVIIGAVAKHFNVSVKELLSHSRTLPLTEYRQMAVYIAAKNTSLSVPAIGRRFGGRDHTTILWAVKKITENYERYRKDIEAIEARIRGAGIGTNCVLQNKS